MSPSIEYQINPHSSNDITTTEIHELKYKNNNINTNKNNINDNNIINENNNENNSNRKYLSLNKLYTLINTLNIQIINLKKSIKSLQKNYDDLFKTSQYCKQQYTKLEEKYQVLYDKTISDDMCCICLTNPKNYINTSCGHLATCKDCTEKLDSTCFNCIQGKYSACPICRTSGQFIRVFTS